MMRYGVFLMLLISAASAWAVEADSRFLDRIDVQRTDKGTRLDIGFTRTFRYITHTPTTRGEVIKIQLSELTRAISDQQSLDGQSALRWTPTADLPLVEVTTETEAGTSPYLIVRFRHPVEFQVTQGMELRSVSVTLPSAKKPTEPEAEAEPSLPSGTGAYALTLASSRSPVDVAAAPPNPAFAGRQLYQLQAQVEGTTRYRLRLGFFDSFAQAEKMRAKLDQDYPGVWLTQVTDAERNAATDKLVVLDNLQIPAIDPSLPALSVARLADLMEQARQAVAQKNYRRAIALYNKVVGYPLQPYQRDAQEYLGLARERKQQYAQAKAIYEDYLERYPKDEASERVRQRLAGLVTASIRAREDLRDPRRTGEGEPWEFFGSLSQYYRRDVSTIDSAGSQVTQSSLVTDIDLNGRKRTDNLDIRTRFTGGRTQDFLDSAGSANRFSSAYVDITTRDGTHSGRIGRQSRTSGGVLGRFDGLYYGYLLNPMFRMNLVSGALVESTENSPQTHRYFNGINLDVIQLFEALDLNLFIIDQRVHGEVDRRAVGGELRYFKDGRSLYSLVDYDIHFDTLNIAYILGNWTLNETTNLNLVLDYRKSPLLTTSNALQGQTVTGIDELKNSFTSEEIKQLAQDRTAISRSATLGASHRFTDRWQLSSDLTMTNMSGTATSGGVTGSPATGTDYFFNMQLIGSNLFREGDLWIPGLRYSDTSTSNTVSASLNARFPVNDAWRVNPRVRVDYRERNAGTTQWIFAPSLRATYRHTRNMTLDFEAGGEWSEERLTDTTQDSSLVFLYLGYRWDF